MISKWLAIIAMIVCAGVTAIAQETKEPPTLKVGDNAPKLTVEEWVKGRPVKAFEKDKVYIVEFWATWCAPCVKAIPHLTELQKKHGRDGLVVIGVAGSERGNDARDKLRRLKNFIGRQGRNMEYTIAFDADESMWNDWMTPAGRGGIPSAFVVDKSGKLAYIGGTGAALERAVERALKSGTAMAEDGHAIQLASWQPGRQEGARGRDGARGQDRQPEAKPEEGEEPRRITIGDKAPPLKVSKWVKGEPVERFEPGKTYIVEFWATWCGPCIVAIPHLTELQEKYKDDVRILGISIWESDPSAVEPFVEEKGEEMGYTVGKDMLPGSAGGGRAAMREASMKGFMARHWMEAAGRNGIPTTFVINKEGRIAWIGHPMQVDEPLAQIVAGTWDLEKFGTEYREARAREERMQPVMMRMQRAMGRKQWDEALAAIDEMWELDESLRPALASQKFNILLLEKKDFDRAYAIGAMIVDDLGKDSPGALNGVAWTIVDPENEDLEHRDLQLALRAAERANELVNGEDGAIMDTLAKVHFDLGNIDKAIELQEKAVSLAAGEMYEQELKDRLEQFKEAKEKGQR